MWLLLVTWRREFRERKEVKRGLVIFQIKKEKNLCKRGSKWCLKTQIQEDVDFFKTFLGVFFFEQMLAFAQ